MEVVADGDTFGAQAVGLLGFVVAGTADADVALGVDDALPGDVGVIWIAGFVAQGAHGVADLAGAAGCAEHGGNAAVAGDFSGGDAQDEGVDLVVEGGWGHEGLAYQIEVLLM